MNDLANNDATTDTGGEVQTEEQQAEAQENAYTAERNTRYQALKEEMASPNPSAQTRRDFRQLANEIHHGGSPGGSQAQENLADTRALNPDAPHSGASDQIAASSSPATDMQIESALTNALGVDNDVFTPEERGEVIDTVKALGVPADVSRTILSEFSKASEFPPIETEAEFSEMADAARDLLVGMWSSHNAAPEEQQRVLDENLASIDAFLEQRLDPERLADWTAVAASSGMGFRPGFLHALLSAARSQGF